MLHYIGDEGQLGPVGAISVTRDVRRATLRTSSAKKGKLTTALSLTPP